MRKKVVVFGGCGFIGTYLIQKLFDEGYNVVAADINQSVHVADEFFVECDILDKQRVFDITEGAFIVYNFAGIANLDDAVETPVETLNLNVMGNLNVLEACRIHNVKRMVYASSAYAMSDKGSFYGISKLTSEKLVEEYYKKYGLEFTIIRYGSVYGERDYRNNYIYNLLKKAYLSNEINHQGDGDEYREYIHAIDVAKLSIEIIQSDKYINQHIILTGVERMKRKELFDMINEMIGGNLRITLRSDGYLNHYKTTPYSFLPTRSKKLVANPYVDMGQGLIDCLEDIERNYGARNYE
ncbi:UDP-glucose 4-epimerase [Allofrancisella inopinata]|uniref:NAD(P)-dependent oxidoreductase n=1 Tax=Allofrancisella inopinata TaxID=1085647 RepID=A0AAE7CR56_9GAMM|nr:NAD(P)-dependent oxidoreductase [Allofrancisella inopinata]QIV96497.1 NAD(P)-dependent oxidoreductase [Allofrancisella inopinata]TDT68510.1 UDP-glucose 4-epimerase [Allofrancisella inopinata]